MANITKTHLIDAVAEKTGFAKTNVKEMLDATLNEISDQTAIGAKVTLTGFGSFQVKERAARTGRNPATGASMEIAASRSLTFKASKTKA